MKPPIDKLVNNLVIVGAGLIGASLAGAVRARGLAANVVAVGRGRENLDTALSRQLVDSVSQSLEPALVDADMIVLAAPVDTCVALLGSVAKAAPPHATISDAGSVKGPIAAAALREGIAARFVGAHPMAGDTNTGAAAARVDLFEGATTVLTPAAAEARHVQVVTDLWKGVGAKVVSMSANEHDARVARSSHLPQMWSYALAAALSETSSATASTQEIYALAGNGLRDCTRLAGSDAAMWKAIANENKQELLAAMAELDVIWTQLTSAIENDDAAALESIIDSAQRFRKGLESA